MVMNIICYLRRKDLVYLVEKKSFLGFNNVFSFVLLMLLFSFQRTI